MRGFEITDNNFNSEFNRAMSFIGKKDEYSFNEFDDICCNMLNYINETDDASALELIFWGFLVESEKNGYSIYSRKASEVGFTAGKELLRRKIPEGVADLVAFTRDNLFWIYLKDRYLYYIMVDEFYKCVMGKYPDIYKDGFRNICKIIKGKDDNGYMDMDYIFITAWCANYGIGISEEGTQVTKDDYRIYKKLVDMYYTFRSFADQEYGYKSYNRPKEVKLYKKSIAKPKGYNKKSDDRFKKEPIWAAMAYATAEASGDYYGRYNIAKILGYGNECQGIKSNEQRIIDKNKRMIIKRLIISLIIVVVVFALGLYFVDNPADFSFIGSIVIFIAVFNFFTGKSSIWYVGHTYIGPAYWFGEH